MKLAKITIFVGQETASVGSMAPVPGGASACTTHWVALGEQARRCRQPLWSEIGCRWSARPSEYTPEVCIFWLHAYMQRCIEGPEIGVPMIVSTVLAWFPDPPSLTNFQCFHPQRSVGSVEEETSAKASWLWKEYYNRILGIWIWVNQQKLGIKLLSSNNVLWEQIGYPQLIHFDTNLGQHFHQQDWEKQTNGTGTHYCGNINNYNSYI